MTFDIKNVKVLHLEPTSRCNAACPQCARFLNDGITVDPRLKMADLTFVEIFESLGSDFIKHLDKMFMCGSYGDPAASNQIHAIVDWFRYVNPNIIIGMNTNGSLRNPKWWSDLGKKLNKLQDYCVFSLDGLADTNHIYRRNTNWDKIIKNITAFMEAGGRAHWDMLVFKHNEHQVEEAKQLAKDMGFASFRAKISRRFDSRPIEGLEKPDNYVNFDNKTTSISCHALNEKSLYIDYTGKIWPCCWFGTDMFNPTISNLSYLDFEKIENSWKSNQPIQNCINSCGVKNNQTKFSEQWVEEINFK